MTFVPTISPGARAGTDIGLKKFLQSGTEGLGRDGTGYLIIRRFDCMMGWGGGGSPILK